MAELDTTRSDLPAIRAVIDVIIKAVRSSDVDTFLGVCAPDVAVFDLVAPLEHKGADAVRQSWAAAVAPFEGAIEYDIDHLDIAISGDLAVGRCFTSFGGTTKEGTRVLNRLRSTLVFRKLSGQWKVVHNHVSVPFDMGTGRALLNLEA